MKRLVVIGAVLLLSTTAAAQESDAMDARPDGVFVDTVGDAPASHDIAALSWHTGNATVTLSLVDPLPNGSAATALLYFGTAGEMEPDQAFILHHGPGGDRVLTAKNGTTPQMEVRRHASDLTFDMDGSLNGECVFAVARTVSYPEGGQQVEDVVGWTGPDVEDAWNEGVACSQGRPVDAPFDAVDEAVDIPAPSVVAALLAALGALAWLRRPQRPQRP